MAQRYQTGVMVVAGAAVTIAHNLSGGTPTEYGAAPHGPSNVYFLGVSSTNIVVASMVATGSANANVFCSIPHTVIQ